MSKLTFPDKTILPQTDADFGVPYGIMLRFTKDNKVQFAMSSAFYQHIRNHMKELETEDMLIGILREDQKFDFVILDRGDNEVD